VTDTASHEQTGLRKELGLRDLVMAQVLCVVGSTWVGVAAKLGRAHVAYWLGAMLLFYVPLAVVVICLNRMMPLEGGLYQWAKSGFGEMAGFLTAWNLWVYAVIVTGSIIFVVPTDTAYILGPAGAWIPSSKLATLALTGGVMAGITLVAIRGLDIGKWLHNAGSIGVMTAYVILLALPVWALMRHSIAHYEPIPWQPPRPSWFGLAIFGQMTVGALSGFEYVAILAGECRSAARTIGQSVALSAPIIALMFILGTGSVLAFVSPDKVDLIAPIPQVFSRAFSSFGWLSILISITIFGVAARQIALMSIYFAGNTRLPMVAGWDNLLPAWFAKLHQRYRTPVNSILFVGVTTLVFSLAPLLGVKEAEAFQFQDNAANVFYALIYMVLFAIPIVAMKRFGAKAPWWLKAAAALGFLMSVVGAFFTVFPIIDVQSRLLFAAKIIAVVIAANAIGAAIYAFDKRSRNRLR